MLYVTVPIDFTIDGDAYSYQDVDHSYSTLWTSSTNTIMSSSSNGTLANRTPRRATAANNDESDHRIASSSSTTMPAPATLANGNSSMSTSGGSTSKLPSNTASFDRGNSIQELKKSLTLDFTNPESAKKSLQTQTPELLSFLRLTSPELEKFLTQGFTQGVSVVQTPTPTQFFFPKNVTNEQEQYARGFLDALNQIYQRSGSIPVNNILSPGFVSSTVTAQEAKEGGQDGSTSNSTAASVFPGPSSSSVQSFNAQLVSNILAAISTPTLSNCAVPEPAFITTVSTSSAQQLRQTLLAASQHHPTAFYALNSRVAFPTSTNAANVLPNIPSSIALGHHLLGGVGAGGSSSTTTANNNNRSIVNLKSEPADDVGEDNEDEDPRSIGGSAYDESRSSSVSSSYRGGNSSNFGSGHDAATAAATALAAMNRNGGGGGHHQYAQHFQHGGGAGATSFLPSTNQHHQQHFLALTSAAQLLMGGGGGHHHQQQQQSHLDHHHNLSSTASASSTASSVSSSGISTKMEISDEQSLNGGRHHLPGTLPLQPEHQEKLKLERKRARNRQAATKCRKRKIERINVLEVEVSQVEDANRNLEDRRDLLIEEISELRKMIEEHQRAKCNIVLPRSNSQFTGTLLKRDDMK